MAEWRFPSNDFGEIKGINDSGVSTFRGTPLQSLAREICQNSLDAAKEDKVMIEFNVFEVENNHLPGADVLLDTFKRCLKFWESQTAETTRDFFEDAIKHIACEKSAILRISDFNTTGLTGSRKEINTDWVNLTKSSGASDKKGTAGGSYGIGKFAPFACSYFSTVFYSTYDVEGLSAYQGVSRLVTFQDESGENTQGIGYFGEERNNPVYEQTHLDPSFSRKNGESGTDIYILGYKFAEGWKRSIIISILEGFLGAIWEGKLEVKFGNEILNKSSLDSYIEKYRDELTGYTAQYYKVFSDSETNWFVDNNFFGLGEVRLGLLIGESDAPNKICMIRKTGMKIMDKGRLPAHIPITGVMQIMGGKINERLRVMENPQHTLWEVDRATNPNEARVLLSKINEFIRKHIEELVSSGEQDAVDAAGVGNYLPDLGDEDDKNKMEETLSDKVLEMEIKAVKRKDPFHEKSKTNKRRKESVSESLYEDDEGNDGSFEIGADTTQWEHDGERKENTNNNPGVERQLADEGKQTKVKKTKDISLVKFITICVDKHTGKYMISAIPSENSKNGHIELYLSAETQNYRAPIKNVSFMNREVTFKDNVISGLEFKKNEQIRLSVQLDYYDYCSMEVKVYAIEE